MTFEQELLEEKFCFIEDVGAKSVADEMRKARKMKEKSLIKKAKKK